MWESGSGPTSRSRSPDVGALSGSRPIHGFFRRLPAIPAPPMPHVPFVEPLTPLHLDEPRRGAPEFEGFMSPRGGVELAIHSTAPGTGFMQVNPDGSIKQVFPP